MKITIFLYNQCKIRKKKYNLRRKYGIYIIETGEIMRLESLDSTLEEILQEKNNNIPENNSYSVDSIINENERKHK